MSDHIGSYFKPASVSWWGGVLLVLSGILVAFHPDAASHPVMTVVTAMAGLDGTSPALLIGLGMGIIGMRAKKDRMHHDITKMGEEIKRGSPNPQAFPPRILEDFHE